MLYRIALIATFATAAVLALQPSPWMRVPGGSLIHKDCIYSVAGGYTVRDADVQPCPYRAALTLPQDQIYAMDVHWQPGSGVTMTAMNATFTAPTLPANDDGQIVYFWPGFKAGGPTMGLPVLQPVLQYGTDCCGGGNYWCVRSWFVWGDQGVAYQSPETPVSPGDSVFSSMSYDSSSQTWTINAINQRTGQNTTLFIGYSDAGDTTYDTAMLVNEIIMDLGECADLPASNTITFTDVSVNGKVIDWTDRVQSAQCGQKITDKHSTVTFNWDAKKNNYQTNQN